MARLDGTTAIVTGASSGIGRAIAEGFAAEGARVALVGRDLTRLDDVVETIESRGGAAVGVVADLDADGAPARVVAEAVDSLGNLTCLVNCAGIFLTGPVEESAELLDRQWQTNVRAPFGLSVAALSHLRRSGGSILFLSSIAGRIGFPSSSAYCATKGAIEQLTRAMAIEEAPNGVRVNAIAPGNIETPMNAELMADPDYKRAMLDATPLGRNGRPEDIVPMALVLASRESSWVTGHSLVVDGGWTAQ